MAEEVPQFNSSTLYSSPILDGVDCEVLMDAFHYNRLIDAIDRGGVNRVIGMINSYINLRIDPPALLFWSRSQSKYYPVTAVISYDSVNDELNIVIGTVSRVVPIDNICPVNFLYHSYNTSIPHLTLEY